MESVREKMKILYRSDIIKSRGIYTDGEETGLWKRYHDNGNLHYMGSYKFICAYDVLYSTSRKYIVQNSDNKWGVLDARDTLELPFIYSYPLDLDLYHLDCFVERQESQLFNLHFKNYPEKTIYSIQKMEETILPAFSEHKVHAFIDVVESKDFYYLDNTKGERYYEP